MDALLLANPVPSQVVNEHAAYGPFDLKEFITIQSGSSQLQFEAQLSDGQALPKGMICTADGILTGIPATDTQGNYEFQVTAANDAGSVNFSFLFTIKPSLASAGAEYWDSLKAQIWEAINHHLPVPEFQEMLNRPITPLEIYYFLERWSTLVIWNAFDLDPPGERTILKLEGASDHFVIYDQGSRIVAAPIDLFSHERTLEDGIQTARAMAREVYQRGWTVELIGFEKLIRAAWLQLQQLGDQNGKYLDIINFNPSPADLELYKKRASKNIAHD